jgi:hypothetical protein
MSDKSKQAEHATRPSNVFRRPARLRIFPDWLILHSSPIPLMRLFLHRRIAVLLLVVFTSIPALAQPFSGNVEIRNFVKDARGQDVWLTFVDSLNWVRNASALPFGGLYRETFERRGFLMMFRPAGVTPDFLNPDFLSFDVRWNTTSHIILHGEHTATLIRAQEWSEQTAMPGLMIMAAGGNPGVVTVVDSRGTSTTFSLRDGRSSMLGVAPGEAVLTAGGRSYSIWLGGYSNYAYFVDGVWYGPSPSAPVVPLETYVPGVNPGGIRVLNMLPTARSYELRVDDSVVGSLQLAAGTATSAFPVVEGDRYVQLKIDGAQVYRSTLKIGPKFAATIAVGDSAGSLRAWVSTASRVPSTNDKALLRVVGTGSASDSLYASIVRSDREYSTGPITSAATPHASLTPGDVVVEVGRIGGDMLARATISIDAGMTYTVVPTLVAGSWTLRRIVDSDPIEQPLATMAPADTVLSIAHIVNVAGPDSAAAITVANESTARVDTTFTLAPFAASMVTSATGSVVVRANVASSADAPPSIAQLLPNFRTTFFIRPSATGPMIDRFNWYTPNEAPDDTAARVRFLSLVESDVEYSASLWTSAPAVSFTTKRGRQRTHETVPAGPAFLKTKVIGQPIVTYATFDLPAGSVSTIIAVGSTPTEARFFLLREDPDATEGTLAPMTPATSSVRDEHRPTLELRRTGSIVSLDGAVTDDLSLEAYDVTGRRIASGRTIDLATAGGRWCLVVARGGEGEIVGSWGVGE